MTAWGSIDLAVEAMRRGAADFVQKPWDNARLLATLDKQVEQVRRTRTEMEIARNVQQRSFHGAPLRIAISSMPAVRRARRQRRLL